MIFTTYEARHGAVRERTKFALWPRIVGTESGDGFFRYRWAWLQYVVVTEEFRQGREHQAWFEKSARLP